MTDSDRGTDRALGAVRSGCCPGRRACGQLVDKAPGGSPAHGLLPEEEAEILALFDEWGETDRSHRKLAHRGPTCTACGSGHLRCAFPC
jgi:hypothetical protein